VLFGPIAAVLLVSLVEITDGSFTNKCMKCICNVESHCNPSIGCRMDKGSLSCGAYQIKQNYSMDCGIPEAGWKACANNLGCAERCVKAYMKRWGTRCTGGREPTCQDYARIHNGGPQGCRKSGTVVYWNKVKSCCGGQTGCNTTFNTYLKFAPHNYDRL